MHDDNYAMLTVHAVGSSLVVLAGVEMMPSLSIVAHVTAGTVSVAVRH